MMELIAFLAPQRAKMAPKESRKPGLVDSAFAIGSSRKFAASDGNVSCIQLKTGAAGFCRSLLTICVTAPASAVMKIKSGANEKRIS